MEKKLPLLIIAGISLLFSCAKKEKATENKDSLPENRIQEILDNETAHPKLDKDVVKYDNGMTLLKAENGDMIWQGDIILTPQQIDILTTSDTRGAILSAATKHWPNGIMYYVWHPDITSSVQEKFEEAMSHWTDCTNITFFRKGTLQANYIEFISGSGNWSYLGMVGGKQQICLDVDAGSSGNAIHEIGHAAGLIHEQSRSDRDNYININHSNIKSSYWKVQYDKEPQAHNKSITFDFESIMLYSSWGNSDMAYDVSKPIMTRKDGTTWYAQRSKLSNQDITIINSVYGAKRYQIYPKADPEYRGTVKGNSRISERGATDIYEWGTNCTLTATPKSGCTFEGWYVDGIKKSSNNIWTFTVYEYMRFPTAKFAAVTGYYIVDLSVASGRTGITPYGTVTGGGSFTNGSKCTVTATPNSGYTFVAWKDLDTNTIMSTQRTYSFTVNRDIRLYADIK